jgi:ketosteroid isomerase-like protein
LRSRGTLKVSESEIVTAGELALLRAKWALRATAPDGSAVERTGRMAAVARRQADGSWRYVIDNAS